MTEHQWAVYAPNGDVLTTLEKASEGSYWLYKQKLEGTVGPYPDRDRPMLTLGEDCPRGCNAGKVEDNTMVAIDEDRNPVMIPHDVDPSREIEFDRCNMCTGFGYVRKGGYNYRNEQSFRTAQKQGKASRCRHCDGRGEVAWVPTFSECYHCKGAGKKPLWDPTRPVLPPEVSDCDNATRQFMVDYLNTITITVVRSSRELTWGESFLGLIGLGTCTDYGRAWEGDDDELIFTVVEDLIDEGPQFIKMIDRASRTFGPALIINVTQQGYTRLIADTGIYRGLGGLPPTYFPAVFKPMSTALDNNAY